MAEMPEWDMSTVFPSLDSPEFKAAFAKAKSGIDELGPLFDRHAVRRRETSTVQPEDVTAFEEVIASLNRLSELCSTVGSYVRMFVATNAAHDLAQSLISEFRVVVIPLGQYEARFVAWVGSMDVESLLAASAVAREHEFVVRQAAIRAGHQMSPAEEELAIALAPTGLSGWARLHNDMTSLLTVAITLDGEQKVLAMSEVRGLANSPDAETRRTAYEAELQAWKGMEVPLAAALNGIKGFQRTLRDRRRWSDDVEPTLVSNSIDRATLEAMQAACVESFPDFRRYLRAKARLLGGEKLAWADLFAPVGDLTSSYPWERAAEYVEGGFREYSDRLADFARRTVTEKWIDWPSHAGKVDGAFCASIRPGESRVLLNHDGSFSSVSTLAHELGHAYHNLCLKDRLPLQRHTPSTLAETASIFCETLITEAALREASDGERLAILEASLQRDCQIVVDIHSRFLFEKGVFERRGQRELSAKEFSDLMLDAQRQTYGDGLDSDKLHPYMWAVKGHYYGPTFYNYPYTFGLLFGLGLYERYRVQPDGFHAAYDDLLSSTGLAAAATLGARFGIDTRSIDFCRGSLDVIRRAVNEFEALCP